MWWEIFIFISYRVIKFTIQPNFTKLKSQCSQQEFIMKKQIKFEKLISSNDSEY